jgi:hypothetical protein
MDFRAVEDAISATDCHVDPCVAAFRHGHGLYGAPREVILAQAPAVVAVHGAGTVRATCVRCTGGNQHVVAVAYKRTAAVRDVQLKVAVATALARVPVDLVPG